MRAGLFAHARIPAWRFEKLIGDWSNLTPGRLTLVAGDPNRTNAFVFANDGAHGDWTTAPIQMAPVDDLSYLVPD